VQFEVTGEIERISGDMETAVYRIVQEALTNIIRHAQATRIDVLLKRRDGSLIVIVEDNGVGFDPKVQINGRLGMVGMQERATMLGGTLTIESVPGSGTTIFLEVPWQSES
jgi:signal transduction histidine kinase